MTIKELRLMKGLTLAAFAKSIGIGMSTLTGYEAGKRQPGEKALAAIKEVYGVDLNDATAPLEAASAAPAEEKAEEKKATKKSRAKKQVAPVKAAPAAPAEEKAAEKPAKNRRAKKQAAPVEAAPAAPVEEKAAEKTAKKPRAKKPAQIIIQSPMGGEITPEEILSRVGDVDKVYVRLDQNAIHWVKGEETGAINIW